MVENEAKDFAGEHRRSIFLGSTKLSQKTGEYISKISSELSALS